MVKEIPLTQGKFALVDDEDYNDLIRFNWFAHRSKRKTMPDDFFAKRHGSKMEKTNFVFIHRHILNPKEDECIDHINGNGLDNRKSNLRIVNPRQNNQNRHDKLSSKYPGVCWSKIGKKWTAQIDIGKRQKKNLGYFQTEKEAFDVYKDAVHELVGEKLVCELEPDELKMPVNLASLYRNELLSSDNEQSGDAV